MNVKKKRNKKRTIITLIMCIVLITLFSTIAYSAIASTMIVDGSAYARIEADVRITDAILFESVNSQIDYVEFGKNHIASSISINDSSSYVMYKVEVTNYGESEVGILSISGIPTTLNYELIDYIVKDKICDTSGKCSQMAKKEFYIKIYGPTTKVEFNINFDFRIFRSITYKNFNNSYLSEVLEGDSISIDLSKDNPTLVQVTGEKNVDYAYNNKILTINNVPSDITVEAIKDITTEYQYTGNYQTFKASYDGMYKIELWGAQGGSYNETYYGGKGGYSTGVVTLNKDDQIYVYVGGAGTTVPVIEATTAKGGYNGGGDSAVKVDTSASYTNSSGGGATDVRLISGTWNDKNSLLSRILVAGGGGGSTYLDGTRFGMGGYGGGLTGGNGTASYDSSYIGGGGTQSATGVGFSPELYGKFGIGGNGDTSGDWNATGAGGGWYGGTAGYSYQAAGGGGSGFYLNSSTINYAPSGYSVSTRYYLTEAETIEGNSSMPTYDGLSTMIGNEGNGYAKITMVSPIKEYSITYQNISGNHQTKIKSNDDLVVNFGEDYPQKISVVVNGVAPEYTYIAGTLTIKNVNGNVEITGIENVINLSYTGSIQTFRAPYTGKYKIELWGAQGGSYNETYYGGYGGYSSGIIELNENEKLYIHVGGQGTSCIGTSCKIAYGGYNGGGNSAYKEGSTSKFKNVSGGGATDVRTVAGSWNNEESLYSRIMVAGGGGGSGYYDSTRIGMGGYGGGTSGGNGTSTYNSNYAGTGGTQTSGGIGYSSTTNGKFGFGGYGITAGDWNAAGAGSGWYGGAAGYGYQAGGGGGSGFVLTSSSISSVPSGYIPTSKYYFSSPINIAGNESMPTHDGTSTMIGNQGNGYAKISYIEE